MYFNKNRNVSFAAIPLPVIDGCCTCRLINVYAETYSISNLQHYPTNFPFPFRCINSQLKNLFFVTLLSAEYKVKWLHGDLPLLSANCCFCNSHWHGGLAPALPGYSGPFPHSQTPPVLSLAYRPCLTDFQPLGSDSILSWYAVRECTKTARLPGSDGYKIAGRLWKEKGEQEKKKLQPAWQNVKKEGRLNSQRSYFTLFSSVGVVVASYWCNWPASGQGKSIVEDDFLFLQNGGISEGSQVPLMCCRSSYWL